MSTFAKWLFVAGALTTGALAYSSTLASRAPTQAASQSAAPVSSPITPASLDSNAGAALLDNGVAPLGHCPFTCNSNAQCTTGCQTEALCSNHRCFPL